MVFQDASVHHNENSGPAGFSCRLLVNYTFLHPDGWDPELDRLIDNFFDEFRASKNIYDIDFLRDVEQRWIRVFAEAFVDPRIDRNDAIAMALHVSGNTVARPHRIAGQPNDSDDFGTAQ